MSSNQAQITYIISKLNDWNESLGGAAARKKIHGSEFDYLQEEFLIKRHETEKLQTEKELDGLSTKTASHSYNIREGIHDMQTYIGKMKQELRKLTKKKVDSQDILQRKQKIINNCERLLEDIEQREKMINDPKSFSQPNKVMTLTDMKAKLLDDIDKQNYQIQAHQGSDGKLTQQNEDNEEEIEAIKKFKKKDQQMDDALDEIIDGIEGVTGKVKQINKKQDQIIEKTKKGSKEVTKVSKRIETDNDKLKKLLQHFGKSRCCMFAVFFLLLIALVVIIIKMLVLG